MQQLKESGVIKYINENIGSDFHAKKLYALSSFELKKLLRSKNPYLFKAKNVSTAEGIVRTLLDAHLSSQEETIFGDFLEGLAIFVCGKVYKGVKSTLRGIDLEFKRDDAYLLVQIKSGPNWGNSSQLRKLAEDFRAAKRFLARNKDIGKIRAINGCCYGRDNKKMHGYEKICGQKFWEVISGNKNLYIDIIKPLGHKAKMRNDKFNDDYSRVVNKFTLEFANQFCKGEGDIDWEKLIKMNSSFEWIKK